MGMSVKLAAAHERAVQHDKELTAHMFKYNSLVVVVHEDGTRLEFRYAFTKVFSGHKDFISVFTEHNGTHTFAKGDLESIHVWELVEVEDYTDYGLRPLEENDAEEN